MKFVKNPILMFILGVVLSGSITAFATIKVTADKITYEEGVSVKDKIDDLYTKVKPLYTDSTTVTPTTSSQTLSTSGKYMSNDITIGAIPSQYKNISDTTITSSNDIVSGKVAYKADGTKLTGTNKVVARINSFVSTSINSSPSLILGSQGFTNYSKFKIEYVANNGATCKIYYTNNWSNYYELSANTVYNRADYQEVYLNTTKAYCTFVITFSN